MSNNDIGWYHGTISREGAEELLKEEGKPDGYFLVRDCTSSIGDFVLSVLQNDQVGHYQIRKHIDDAFYSLEENTKIHGLDTLIKHYQTTGQLNSDGLKLSVPCKGDPPPHESRRYGNENLLHRAVSRNNYTVVSELLKSGYKLDKLNAKNHDGQTVVHIASQNGSDCILCKLIESGAEVNFRDSYGNTPLHNAAQNNFPNTVRLLVEVGKANIQARNNQNKWVPMHDAANRGYVDVVKELLRMNAPANPRTVDSKLPSQLAKENGHTECAEILENYQTSPKTDRSKWYHGTLGRQEAEKVMRDFSNEDGTFLVRYSQRNTNVFVLSLLYNDAFFNYIIDKQDDYLYIDDGPLLNSLEHIIEYYSFIADGLPTILSNPVPPQPKPPIPEFSTMPRPKRKVLNSARSIQELASAAEPHLTSDLNSIPSQLSNITFTSNITPIYPINNNNNVTGSNGDLVDRNEDYIPSESLKLGDVIGQGEFGSVYKGVYINPNGDTIPVAVKTLRREHLDTNKEAFLSEARLMMNLKHNCIVRLIGLSDGPPLLMIQELVSLGSMLAYVIMHKEQIKPNVDFKIWAAQIASGMKYLEEKRFVHRDLAARNILLASVHQVKISDFGLSRALGTDHEYYKSLQGGKWPLKWYAPESYNYGNFSHASDVWSFGITLWEMYSYGEQPYGDLKGAEAIKLIERGERLPKPQDCPEHIYEQMRRCWAYDAEDRPTFSKLLEVFCSDKEYTNIKEMFIIQI